MARALLAKSAPTLLIAIVLCGALTGCVYPGPTAAYPAAYPVYVWPRPVVVAAGGWGWHRWR